MASTDAPAESTTIALSSVKVEDIGPAKKRLTITIPVTSIDARIEESFGTLATQAVLPGFRKGRAPRPLLERRFGEGVRLEAKNQLIGMAYSQALEENKIRPVGEPELDEATRTATLEVGKPMTVVIDVEVVPTFDLPGVEGVEIRKPTIEVSDQHIDLELKRQEFRFGTPARITGPFQAYDRLLCRATVRKEGLEGVFFETDRTLVIVPGKEDEGRGQVLGVIVDGFEDSSLGKSVGEVITVNTTGPEFHEREDVRGAKLTIELDVRDAERITPAAADELVDRFGLGTLEVLREQIRLALEQRRDLEQRSAMREQLYEHLLAAVDFPLPENMSANQLTRLIERQRVELIYRGTEPAQVETELAQMRGSTEAQSQSRLKLFFVLASFAEKFEINVSEGEVNGRIAAMARQRGERPEKLRNDMAQSGHLNEIGLSIREHKTADRLLEKCTIVDVDAEAWNREVAERQVKGGAAPAAAGKTPAKSSAKASEKPADKSSDRSDEKSEQKSDAKPRKKSTKSE